jgi:hypothetical protein
MFICFVNLWFPLMDMLNFIFHKDFIFVYLGENDIKKIKSKSPFIANFMLFMNLNFKIWNIGIFWIFEFLFYFEFYAKLLKQKLQMVANKITRTTPTNLGDCLGWNIFKIF